MEICMRHGNRPVLRRTSGYQRTVDQRNVRRPISSAGSSLRFSADEGPISAQGLRDLESLRQDAQQYDFTHIAQIMTRLDTLELRSQAPKLAMPNPRLTTEEATQLLIFWTTKFFPALAIPYVLAKRAVDREREGQVVPGTPLPERTDVKALLKLLFYVRVLKIQEGQLEYIPMETVEALQANLSSGERSPQEILEGENGFVEILFREIPPLARGIRKAVSGETDLTAGAVEEHEAELYIERGAIFILNTLLCKPGVREDVFEYHDFNALRADIHTSKNPAAILKQTHGLLNGLQRIAGSNFILADPNILRHVGTLRSYSILRHND